MAASDWSRAGEQPGAPPGASRDGAADPFATPRPRLRPSDAVTTLVDFAMVTYDVDPERLSAVLPDGYGLQPEVVTLRDGRRRGLVSAVNFRDVDFRVAAAPFLRVSFVQTNFRAYVTRHGRRGVWFFGTTLGSRLSVVPRRLWGMPWYPVRGAIDASWDGDRCLSYTSRSSGRWGSSQMRLEGTGGPAPTALDGFADADVAALVLTHPLAGYFAHRRGGVGRYEVWHERLRPTLGRALEARFDAFEQLGLVERDQTPHSVLLQPSTEFLVLLPPQRLRRDALAGRAEARSR